MRFKRVTSNFRCLALAAVLGAASLTLTAAPPATAATEQIVRKTLPNGMRVLLVENHSKPLVAACVFVNGGSRTETPGLSGLSHYYEHLIFRGGSTRQAELEFRKQMQRIGQESGGYTTNDYTCYGFTAPTPNFDEALWRTVDAWMNLKLTQEKVAKERQVVMEEYNQGEDRPDYKVYYQIERLMFRDHPYKRDTIGLKDVIEHASLATFRTFYDERYVPNQMILTLAGDFDADSLCTKIARAFAPYKRGRDDFEQALTERPQAQFRMGVEHMKTPSTWTYLGFHVPPYADSDAPALTVFATLLGKGTSSRLYKVLKERENLVTSIDADFEVRKDPGMFLIGAELPPENEARVFGLIRDELKRLAVERVPAAELERVKSGLQNRYAFDAQTVFDRAERLCRFALMSDASIEPLWPSLIQSVTADDIQRLARKCFTADLASYSVIRPEGVAGPKDDEIEAMLPLWRQGWPVVAEGVQAAALRKDVLPNGVTLLLKEDHGSPIVAVRTMARGGQWIEPEGLAGVSNMAAAMLRRGAGTMTARDISERADALGMTLGTGGAEDYATVAWIVPARNFGKAWDIYRDVLLRPTFPADEVAKVRQDLIRNVKSLGDRPFDYTNLQFQSALYKNSPYRRAVTGDTLSLARIQVSDLKKAYEAMFCGSNLVVTIVGDFDAASTLELARRTFAPLRRGNPAVVGNVRDQGPAEKQVRFVDKEQEQVTYNTGWLTCSVRDPDYVPLKAAVSYVGDKVFFKYVYEKGVAYRSWFYMNDRMGQGSAQNEMGVTPANFPMASSGVIEDVSRTVRDGITPGELKGSIEKMLSRYYLDAQDDASQAKRLCYYELAGLGYEFADRYPVMLRSVGAAEVNAAARKYLDPSRYTRVAVGNEAAAKAPDTATTPPTPPAPTAEPKR